MRGDNYSLGFQQYGAIRTSSLYVTKEYSVQLCIYIERTTPTMVHVCRLSRTLI